MMAVRRRISFKERLAGAGIGLVICFAAMPIAIIATILLMPFWSWLEASIAIEAVGHSGPAEWCYLFIYLLMVTAAGFLWSASRRSTAS